MSSRLVQCACFDCRKSFKRAPTSWDHGPKCPDCGGATSVMGKHFRAPAVRAARQWRKVELLYRAGVRFANYGPSGLERMPDTLGEAKQFIRRHGAKLAVWQMQLEKVRLYYQQKADRQVGKRRELAIRRQAQLRARFAGGTAASKQPARDG